MRLKYLGFLITIKSEIKRNGIGRVHGAWGIEEEAEKLREASFCVKNDISKRVEEEGRHSE